MNFQSIADRVNQETGSVSYLKGLFYGPPGTGKTTLLGTAGKKGLLLDTDGGSTAIRNLDDPPDVFRVRNWDDINDAYLTLSMEKHDWEYVMLDTVTTLEGLASEEADLAGVYEKGGDPRRAYGQISTMMRHKLSQFARLPMHVVFTAHLRERDERDIEEGKYPIVPDVQASVQRVALALPDIIGRTFIRDNNGKIEYGIAFGGDPRSIQKQRALGLPDEVAGSSVSLPKLVEIIRKTS